jgi:hypothetical protein
MIPDSSVSIVTACGLDGRSSIPGSTTFIATKFMSILFPEGTGGSTHLI